MSLSFMLIPLSFAGNGAEPSSNPEAHCDANPFQRGCPVFRASNGKSMEFNTKEEAMAFLSSHPVNNEAGKKWIWKKSPSNLWTLRWK